MVELLFIACLTGSPDVCEERNLLYYGVTPMSCMLGAQGELAKWAEQHPGQTISRWSCRSQRPGEQKA